MDHAPSFELIRAVAAAYDENQALFPFGRVTFSYWKGEARSLDRARAGKLDPAYRAQGLLVFDEKHASYERLFSADDTAAATQITSEYRHVAPFSSWRAITNGEKSLTGLIEPTQTQDPIAYSIEPGTDTFCRILERLPGDLGSPAQRDTHLSSKLRKAIEAPDEHRVLAVEEHVDLDGVDTLKIELQPTPNVQTTYWVDLQRGAIPIRQESYLLDLDQRSVIVQEDLRHVPGHGWLPFARTLHIEKLNMVQRIVIDEIDFDHRPAPEAFTIPLDSPELVGDLSTGLAMTLRDVIDLDNLPGPAASNVVRINTTNIGLGDIEPGEIQARPPYLLWGGLALSALLAATLLLRWWTHR